MATSRRVIQNSAKTGTVTRQAASKAVREVMVKKSGNGSYSSKSSSYSKKK